MAINKGVLINQTPAPAVCQTNLKMTANNAESPEESIFPEADIVYSKFWDRLGAYLLDGCIVLAVTLPLSYFNITSWKIPSLYILIGLISILYKPVLECRYGATLGKMIVRLEVVGHDFGKITVSEEVKRVSFYLSPPFCNNITTALFRYGFDSINNYRNQQRSRKQSSYWDQRDCICICGHCRFFVNQPNRALHDVYGTM
jgi:hypothetical protein